MKTQITTIAAAIALAMSATALAGSDSTIDQTGDDNVNNVTQYGTQESRIYQYGDDNTATVTQDDNYRGGENYSNIEQTDDGNSAEAIKMIRVFIRQVMITTPMFIKTEIIMNHGLSKAAGVTIALR